MVCAKRSLAFVALLPEFLLSRTSIPFYLGGTALLIVVVVMIDFITQVQSHLFQHQYENLLRKTKLKMRQGKKSFKTGYKKAIVTLKKGQSIDLATGI